MDAMDVIMRFNTIEILNANYLIHYILVIFYI
jgi:hypothetical protein